MSKITTFKLDEPIGKGNAKISSFELRKPSAGELRGVPLIDIFQMDVAAYDLLLPRITNPALDKHKIGEMCFEDISRLMGEVTGFLESKA